MLYLVDGIQSFTFLDAVVRFLLPLSTMDDYRSNILDPPAMDPKPPDHSSLPTPPVPSRDPPLPLTLLGPTRSPSSPHQTTSSNRPSPPSELDLVRSLEALQVSSYAAQRSRRLAEESLSTRFNILVKVADPLGPLTRSPNTQQEWSWIGLAAGTGGVPLSAEISEDGCCCCPRSRRKTFGCILPEPLLHFS